MSQHKNPTVKAAYVKPTLTEYGSLAERTKIFGLPEGPIPDIITGNVVITGSPSITTVISR